jgi:ribosome-binding factor A
VNELLKRELSSIITREISFDGALVTLNQVDVTPDLKHAHAYISVLGKEDQTAAMAKLEAHRVVLQHELAKAVTLKYTPQLVFHLDDSIERGARVFEILQEIETPEKE